MLIKKLFRDKSTFFCFTQAVMLATFLIEVVAVHVFARYKMSAFASLAALIILVLILFQAAEYKVCSGTNPVLWSRVGFALITLFPVLGLHLISCVTYKKRLLTLDYALAFAFLLWMLLEYFSFIIPMGIVYTSPEARSALPSIMCGFALILAFILALKIVPLHNK